MVHVVQGRIVEKRSPFRLSIISDLFWSLMNVIGQFFETMFSLEKANHYRRTGKTTGARSNNNFGGGGGGGGGNPRGPRNRGPRIAGIKDYKSSGNVPGGG
ncbi:selenoprotein K-like domain-containing protein [Chloropicon primus]|uniref:Selenoprotein K n=1 Tax=Chloropicon primus TaxID=1764295 RepID=A0A5B8MNW3_9CHLO|nr:hypothetical protein A3770_07p47410 [Chloropicon primus]UPR01441.1 selenoprotein K-like domain-containing protein [Chloropicon primus]|eukprot:QDZ22223.1 hypothetical protein A3770_07p47410 [Chloropicon primus]